MSSSSQVGLTMITSQVLNIKDFIFFLLLFSPTSIAWLSPLYPSLGFPDSSVGKESACNAGDPGSIPGSGRSSREGISYPIQCSWISLVAQLIKNPPATSKTWVWSLGWEKSPEEGKGYPLQYSCLENSMDCIAHGVARSQTRLSHFHLHFTSPHTQFYSVWGKTCLSLEETIGLEFATTKIS